MSRPVVLFLTWLFPGLGHWILGERRRAVLYGAVILVSFSAGLLMHGRLYGPARGDFISWLATAANAGVGLLYPVVKLLFGYDGDAGLPLSEYGTIFILSAGLMNWLLLLETEALHKGDAR